LFSGSRKGRRSVLKVPDSNSAQSGPNAFADMQSTSMRERSRPSPIWAGMLSPGLVSRPSNPPFTPSARNRSASGHTTYLSFALWLRKAAQGNLSGMAGVRVASPMCAGSPAGSQARKADEEAGGTG